MALTDLTKKILADGEKEAESIISEAQYKTATIEKEASKQKVELEKTAEKNLSQILDKNKSQTILSAQKEVKMRIDSEKRGLLDKSFESALDTIVNYGDKQYTELLTRLVASLPQNLNGTFFAPKNRLSLTKNILKTAGQSGEVQPSDDFSGGILYKGANAEYDLSFTTLLANKKADLEIEVSKILFN